MLSRSFVLAALLSVARSALYESVNDLKTLDYDFVIVGAGTAGSVIANRLTEDPSVSVLILEAGGSDAGIIATPPLAGGGLAPFTQFDWNYTTTAQAGLNGRSAPYPRGFVLGGSSSINYLLYTRGASDDWDRYAKLSGDDGLSWHNVQKYFARNEKFVPPNDGHNTKGQFNPAVHSTKGLVENSLPGYPWPEDQHVINTTHDHGYSDEFPFNLDQNGGDVIGIGWAQAMVGEGQRSSAATAYLASDFISRPNLDVLLHARVTRLVQTDSAHGLPIFQTVEFTNGTDATAARLNATAKREIILSAGAFNTPQLLLLSGIGSSADLKAVGLKQIVSNPSVGKNMTDHTGIDNTWRVNTNETYETYLRDPATFEAQLEIWQKTAKGPLSYTLADEVAWLRLPDNSTIFQTTPDPSPGPHAAHYEFVFSNGFAQFGLPFPATGNYFSIVSILALPTARGTVTINSTDPFAPPVIDPAVLGTDYDIATSVAAIRAAIRFVSSPSMQTLIVEPFGDLAAVYNGTDADLEAYARSHANPSYHAVGTVGLGPAGDKTWGGVDPKFRVKGQLGIRVVDASVVPIIPSAHVAVPIYVFAERAADLIKETWSNISDIKQWKP